MPPTKRKRVPLPSGSAQSLGLGKKWKISTLPSEALSGEGLTDAEFFDSLRAASAPSSSAKKSKRRSANGEGRENGKEIGGGANGEPQMRIGLDEGLDAGEDWMGLAEMEGVQVIREGNTVKLVPAEFKGSTLPSEGKGAKAAAIESQEEGTSQSKIATLQGLEESSTSGKPLERDDQFQQKQPIKKRAAKRKDKGSKAENVRQPSVAEAQAAEPEYSANFKLLPMDDEANDSDAEALQRSVSGECSGHGTDHGRHRCTQPCTCYLSR